MQLYEIVVRGRSVFANSRDMTLVRTSIGIDQVHVLFDNPEWLEFPITITFAQEDTIVTQALVTNEILGSDEWVAEGTAVIPWEVIRLTGQIRVTLQGTDSNGRHIITAKGAPLSVEEAGDAIDGVAPSDAPTIDQWQQAYASAVAAANDARSLIETFQSRVDDIISSAESVLDTRIDAVHTPATTERLGSVIVGEGLDVDDTGKVSVIEIPGITDDERNQLSNLAALVYYCFNTTFDGDGKLEPGAKLRSTALPKFPVATVATPGVVMPDGTSVTIDTNGLMHFIGGLVHEWDGTTLRVTSSSGTSEADLVGPSSDIVGATGTVDQSIGDPSVSVSIGGTPAERTLAFSFSGIKGETGERGPQGPPGYVLTDEDVETISDEILSRYELAESERY